MNHLAKYLTMKIIPKEYENDLDQIELAVYGMEGLLCNLSTLFVAIILSFIFHTTYEFVLFIFFFIPLRLSYKSFHCSSFLQCLVFSNMIILFASYFIKYVTNIPFLRLICLSLIVANYTLSFEKTFVLSKLNLYPTPSIYQLYNSWLSPRPISTSPLHASRHFHF